MPPSTPTASMSPGRLAMLEPANTPLKKEQLQREIATVKERYLGHAVFSALLLSVFTFDCFWLSSSLSTLLTCDYFGLELTRLLNQAVIVFSLVWVVLSGFHSIYPEGERDERGGRTEGESESGSKRSTVLTSTPAVTGTSLPMTPQRGGRTDEIVSPISPIYPIPENTIFGTPQQSSPMGALRNRRADYRPLYGASSPTRPDLSWIDDHDFGVAKGAAANRSALSLSSTNRSRNVSFASGPTSPSSTGAGLIADLGSSAPFQARVASLPATKMLTSIHTQEQVDMLLSKSRAEAAAMAAAGAAGDKLNPSTSFYQAMLQLDGLELHPFQMSKDAAENKSDPYELVYDANGGVHLSPRGTAGTSPSGSDDTARFRVELAAQRAAAVAAASASGGASPIDGRRRRLSHHSSSPSRGPSGEGTSSGGQTGGVGGGGVGGRRRRADSHSALSESELNRAEQRMRIWIVNTIIRPVHNGIKDLNKLFDTELAPLHLRIGTSSVEQITTVLTAHPELVQTMIPYILPYLRAYLVARIAALSVGNCMADFSWASGGPQPAGTETATDKASLMMTPRPARMAPRPWNDTLPTDTQLVLSLFAAYMDTKVTTCAVVQGHNVDQPFSSRYTLIAPSKPTALHQSAGAFYVHLTSLNPPSLEFVSIAVDGQATITTRHLFRALVLFLAHAAYENDGKIDRLALSNPVLNLDMVLTGKLTV